MLASGTNARMTTGVAAHVLVADLAAAAVEVADDAADEVLRRHHFDIHDRLEQLTPRLLAAFSHRSSRSDFEGERRRVDFVEGAVISVTFMSTTGSR